MLSVQMCVPQPPQPSLASISIGQTSVWMWLFLCGHPSFLICVTLLSPSPCNRHITLQQAEVHVCTTRFLLIQIPLCAPDTM